MKYDTKSKTCAIYAFVFVSAGFQEKFGFVGEEEGLQTPSRVRFDIQLSFFNYIYIYKALNSTLGVSQ